MHRQSLYITKLHCETPAVLTEGVALPHSHIVRLPPELVLAQLPRAIVRLTIEDLLFLCCKVSRYWA